MSILWLLYPEGEDKGLEGDGAGTSPRLQGA